MRIKKKGVTGSEIQCLNFIKWPELNELEIVACSCGYSWLTRKGQLPKSAPMQRGDECIWYLIKFPDHRFAVQYSGNNPDMVFPMDITGCSKANCCLMS